MYELLKEDHPEDAVGPTALARRLGESTQAVVNWGRSPGVSSKAAIKAQRLLKWRADYILFGDLPKRITPTLSELLEAPIDITPQMLTYAPIKGKLNIDMKTALARLEEESKDERYVLVVYKQSLREGLEAYQVEKGDLGRVRQGEYIVVHSSQEPSNGDEVLVCQGDAKQTRWSLERYMATTTSGTHLFYDLARGVDATKPIKDFVRWCLVVALNSSQSVIPHQETRHVRDKSPKNDEMSTKPHQALNATNKRK